jgi:hypothetical protein
MRGGAHSAPVVLFALFGDFGLCCGNRPDEVPDKPLRGFPG